MNDSLKVNFTDQLQKVLYLQPRPSLETATKNAKALKTSNVMTSASKNLSGLSRL